MFSLKKSIRELKPAEIAVEEDEEEEDEEAKALREEQERRAQVKPKFKEGNTVLFRYRVLRDGQPTALRVHGQVRGIGLSFKNARNAKKYT